MIRREEYIVSKNFRSTTLMKIDIGNKILKTPKKKTLKKMRTLMKKFIKSRGKRSLKKRNHIQRRFSRTSKRNLRFRFSRTPKLQLDHQSRNPQQNNQPSMFTIPLWKFISLETTPQ